LKPLADGYLFEAQSPWVFGRCGRYIVTEEQKAALLGILRPARSMLRLILTATIITVITCGIALLWWCRIVVVSPEAPVHPFRP